MDPSRLATIQELFLGDERPFVPLYIARELRDGLLAAQADLAIERERGNGWRKKYADDTRWIERITRERDVVQAENQRLTTENERLERMLAGTNVRWSEKLHEAERKERERLTEEYGRMQMALVELLPERDCLARQVNAATDGLRDLLEGALDMRRYVPGHFAEKWDHDSYIERATAVLAAFTTTKETPA